MRETEFHFIWKVFSVTAGISYMFLAGEIFARQL